METKFRSKVGPKGEIIILNLENRRIYIEPKKKDPAIIFKQIAEAKPIPKEICDKSYEGGNRGKVE